MPIDGYHVVAALLCHVFEQQELAVTCIYENAVQVPELPLDRGEHRVEVGEIADVRANGETSGSERLLRRLQRPLIQAADGDARALFVEFLRRGQPDPAVAAGDKDILAASLPIVVTPSGSAKPPSSSSRQQSRKSRWSDTRSWLGSRTVQPAEPVVAAVSTLPEAHACARTESNKTESSVLIPPAAVSQQRGRSAPQLPNIVSQAVFCIARFVKTLLHQTRDPLLRGWSPYCRHQCVPLRCDFDIGRQLGTLARRLVSTIACLSNEAIRVASASTNPSRSASGNDRFT